jgi:hypothetical protein
MTAKLDVRTIIIYALLALHTLWIVNHVRLVYQERINPWKLGGYGMYTVPTLGYRLQLVDLSVPDFPMVVPKQEVSWQQLNNATRFSNVRRAFRCAPVPAHALYEFFRENPQFVGRKVAIQFHERKFTRKPPWFEPVMKGQVIVEWQDKFNFGFTNQFCGEEEKSTGKMP